MVRLTVRDLLLTLRLLGASEGSVTNVGLPPLSVLRLLVVVYLCRGVFYEMYSVLLVNMIPLTGSVSKFPLQDLSHYVRLPSSTCPLKIHCPRSPSKPPVLPLRCIFDVVPISGLSPPSSSSLLTSVQGHRTLVSLPLPPLFTLTLRLSMVGRTPKSRCGSVT